MNRSPSRTHSRSHIIFPAALVAGVFTLAGLARPASAVDLSNNLSATPLGTETATPTRRIAASFTTDAAAHTLSSVTLQLSSAVAASASVALYSDLTPTTPSTPGLGLQPGSSLATLTFPGTVSTSATPITFAAPGGIALTPSTTYWIILTPTSGSLDWSWTAANTGSGTGFTHVWAISEDSGSTWWSCDIYPPQFSITVDACTCLGDFNCANGATVQDIFDFLAAWFAGSTTADINHIGGITVQDIFDFLAAWFAGC